MAIKAIIFDFEGVILKTKDNDLSMTIAKKLDAPYEQVRDLLHSGLNDQVDLGEISEYEHRRMIVESLNMSKDKIDLIAEVMDAETYIDHILMKKIGGLRKQYKIGLLSNYSNDMRPLIEAEWKVEDVFDEVVISSEVGVIKPDPAMFKLILERLGVKAEEAVFVDDRIKNIEGAKKMGIETIFYETREQTLRELERILETQW